MLLLKIIWLYSSLLRSIGSWYLNIQWLGDILERDHHTVMRLLKCFLKIKRKKLCPQKVEKTTSKSCLPKQKFRRFRNFSFTAQQPKWQNSCSQMWPIEQLYIELGNKQQHNIVLVLKSQGTVTLFTKRNKSLLLLRTLWVTY